MSKEAIEALKYVRLDPPSGIKTSILHQLAVLHRSDKGFAYPGIDFLAQPCGIGRFIKEAFERARTRESKGDYPKLQISDISRDWAANLYL